MIKTLFQKPKAFAASGKAIAIHIGKHSQKQAGLIHRNAKNVITKVEWDIRSHNMQQEGAKLCQFLADHLTDKEIKPLKFELKNGLKAIQNMNEFCLGWGLAHYQFTPYKPKAAKPRPTLILPKTAESAFVKASLEGIFLLRNLVNTPANDLGTDELAHAAKHLADQHKATCKIIKGKKLESDFPLIHTVGKASPRPPQLIELNWGKAKDPKLTLVGKGIIYDTGGLNLKPGQFMRDMKKDMGGAAHVLGLAHLIMALKLPVRLTVLIPAAENSVAGESFRPGDIVKSRKGLSVEIADTDAEGRLVVADALTYACESKPDLLVDFCTLTGAARVALGYDIPAFFSNQEKFLDNLRKESVKVHDPVWPLPLWDGYEGNIDSPFADVVNDGKGRGGAIEAALFLQRFVEPKTPWIHLDCFAWEQNGKPGRPHGGADTGMRALFDFIQKRYT